MHQSYQQFFRLMISVILGLSSWNTAMAEGSDFLLSLTSAGFGVLSQKLTKDVLTDIHNQQVADFDTDVGYGIQGYFSGMNYSIDFRKIELYPADGHLRAHVEFNAVTIKADTIKFTKKVGVTLKTTCKDTTMTAGGVRPLSLDFDLTAAVRSDRIDIDIPHIDFGIPNDLYDIEGPKDCSGDLGIGNVIKYSLNRILNNAKDQVETAARTKVKELAPQIEQELERLTRTTVPFSTGGIAGLPDRTIYLSLTPASFVSSSSQAVISLKAMLSRPTLNPISNIQPHQLTLSPTLATFAVRNRILNELLIRMTPTLPMTIPVETSSGPLDQIFNRSTMSSMLPDLSYVSMDQEEIGLRMGLGQPPQIRSLSSQKGSNSMTLQLLLPDLRLYLDIFQNGLRVPYFELLFQASLQIVLEQDGNALKLLVKQPAQFSVSGQWAPGYIPTTPIFEQDVAQMLFGSALEILFSAGPLSRIQLPPLTLGSGGPQLRIQETFSDQDYLGVRLSGF